MSDTDKETTLEVISTRSDYDFSIIRNTVNKVKPNVILSCYNDSLENIRKDVNDNSIIYETVHRY